MLMTKNTAIYLGSLLLLAAGIAAAVYYNNIGTVAMLSITAFSITLIYIVKRRAK
jgi:hypothetical protein